MTHLHLPLHRHFTKRGTEQRIKEQRVVAKPIRTARLLNQLALHFTPKSVDELPFARERHYANKPGRSVAYAAHPLKQQPIIGIIGSIRARKSSRVNAGSPGQRIYFEPGIIHK